MTSPCTSLLIVAVSQARHLGVQRGDTLQLRRTPGSDVNFLEAWLLPGPVAQLDQPGANNFASCAGALALQLPPPLPPPRPAITASSAERQAREEPTSSDTAVCLPLSCGASPAADTPHTPQYHLSEGSQPGSAGCSGPGPYTSVESVQVVLSQAMCGYRNGLYLTHGQAAALMPPDSQVLMLAHIPVQFVVT